MNSLGQTEVGSDLLRLTRECRHIDVHLSTQVGLTVDEMHCLSVIFSEKPACVKELSRLLDINATRTSKLLWNLEQKELVTRSLDASDHRKELISLTEAGVELVKRTLSLYTEIGSRLFGERSSELIADFSRLVRSVPYSG